LSIYHPGYDALSRPSTAGRGCLQAARWENPRLFSRNARRVAGRKGRAISPVSAGPPPRL